MSEWTEEKYAIMSPGGRIIYRTIDYSPEWAWIRFFEWAKCPSQLHETNRAVIRGMLEDGWKVVKVILTVIEEDDPL